MKKWFFFIWENLILPSCLNGRMACKFLDFKIMPSSKWRLKICAFSVCKSYFNKIKFKNPSETWRYYSIVFHHPVLLRKTTVNVIHVLLFVIFFSSLGLVFILSALKFHQYRSRWRSFFHILLDNWWAFSIWRLFNIKFSLFFDHSLFSLFFSIFPIFSFWNLDIWTSASILFFMFHLFVVFQCILFDSRSWTHFSTIIFLQFSLSNEFLLNF